MPERLHPGVYVEEVKPAVLAIEGVSTSTAAFIGVAERGPVNRATLVTSFAEYQRLFGSHRPDSFLTYSVQNFFNNGGKKCYIVRVMGAHAATASLTLADREHPFQAERTLTVTAANAGKWGNDLDMAILDSAVDPVNEFKLVVKYRNEIVETFDNLSMDPTNENFVENVINGSSQYITVASISQAQTNAPGVLLSGKLDPKFSLDLPAAFNIQLDGDAGAQPVKLDGSGSIDLAAVAEAIQEVFPSLPGDSYAAATCEALPFGNPVQLIIRSGSPGPHSTVVVTTDTTRPGTVTDAASALKLRLDDGALSTPGVAVYLGTSTSGNAPARSLTSGANSLVVNIDQDGPKTIVLQPPPASGVDIARAIEAAVRDPSVIPNDPAKKPAYDGFKAEYVDQYRLAFGKTASGSLTVTIADNPVSQALGISGETADLKSTAPFPILTKGSVPPRDLSKATPPQLSLTLPASTVDPAQTIDCPVTGDLTSGEAIAATIQAAVRAKAASAGFMTNDSRRLDILASLSHFTCEYVSYYRLTVGSVPKGDPRDSSLRVTSASANDAAAALKLGGPNGGAEQDGAALLRPIPSTAGDFHLGDHPEDLLIRDVRAGSDGLPPTDQTYVGDGVSTGFNALDKITDVNLIAVPGIGSKLVVSAGFGYCANRTLLDCFFIADLGGAPPADVEMFRSDVPFVTGVTQARDYVRALPTKNDYGAIYFPWLEAPDPIGRGKNPRRMLPPSGYVAGMYARIDNQRGVFKAPAGTEANLSGALNVAAKIDDIQQDFLNPIGVNVIRAFPASGIVIWGTRTLASDSAWRYVPVRRMAIFLRISIYNGIQWAVFEPNDEDLWASLRLTVGAFMLNQFRAGAFQGDAPAKAFFVKCDATTTIQSDIDNGVVNILVGFAPLKPAEFVILKLSQKAGQPAS